MYSLAREACEGSYCFGDKEYEQEFIVNGVLYLGTLTVEYKRYDKQYYYIETAAFTIEEIKP